MNFNYKIITIFLSLFSFVYAEGEKKKKFNEPQGAVILLEKGAIYQRSHSKHSAIEISDGALLKKLESFFPDYKKVPSNKWATGHRIGYTVFFNFPNAKTLRISISTNGKSWTMKGGSIKVDGDFIAFIAELNKKIHAKKTKPQKK
ncbi:MAG: hypothetical protein HRT89_00445 [Lentisphaeria bacterium]|nr:hypothetical protein [Lentisphaeria bacterium]NQZ66511.1 hypothetical protein [Lentisphaeria bacterium]